MPDSGNEVTDQKRPSPAPFEPGVYAREAIRSEMENPSVLDEDICIEDPSERVAHGDSAGASQKCREERWNEQECVFKDEITGERQQPFVRHRQTDDSEHKQREDSHVSVLRDPVKGRFSHPSSI